MVTFRHFSTLCGEARRPDRENGTCFGFYLSHRRVALGEWGWHGVEGTAAGGTSGGRRCRPPHLKGLFLEDLGCLPAAIVPARTLGLALLLLASSVSFLVSCLQIPLLFK